MATTIEQQKLVHNFCKKYKALPLLPLGKKQSLTSQDTPAKGTIWICRTHFVAPADTSIRDRLCDICDAFKSPSHGCIRPKDVSLEDVGVEFIGPRYDVPKDAPEPDLEEHERMFALEKDCQNNMTVLYVHGGGFCFSSPIEFRAATAQLARLTGARVASIWYRLAPQHTFPTQLLDALVAYANLLHPPPGAAYTAVPANRLVLAGNSAGANLCFALLKVLLELQRSADPEFHFHDQRVRLPLPAGVTSCSGWIDQSACLPSWRLNGENDIFEVLHPMVTPKQPSDDIWPATPPREHPYCDAAMLDHELISPAAIEDWKGAPPMWIAAGGEERCLDGNKAVASQAMRCGVPVVWTEYSGMPHEFPLLLGQLPQAKHYLKRWAEICLAFVNKQQVRSRSLRVQMPDCEEVEIQSLAESWVMSNKEIRERMKDRNARRQVFTGDATSQAKL